MLIDWFTVGAQALNFLLLVWLMKHFLYQPVLKAIDARETLIARQLADANQLKALAQQERTKFENKNTTFDQQQAARLCHMTKAVKSEGERLLKVARQTADEHASQRRLALQKDAQTLAQSLRQGIHQQVFAITRQTLGELAGIELEQAMVRLFTSRLHNLEGVAKARLTKALHTAPKTTTLLSAVPSAARIRSAFALGQDQQSTIQQALNQSFSTSVTLSFETAPRLISGIELLVNGEKLSWSIDTYLQQMEQEINSLLSAHQTAQNPAPSQSDPETKTESAKKTADPKLNKTDQNNSGGGDKSGIQTDSCAGALEA